MRIVPLPAHCLRVGHPLPFALLDSLGALLIGKGRVIPSQTALDALLAKSLWVNGDDIDAYAQAYANKLAALTRQPVDGPGRAPLAAPRESAPDWPVLLFRTTALLLDTAQLNFCQRIATLREDLLWHLARDTDRSLLVLVHSTAQDLAHYSAWHALLVAAVCELSGRHLPSMADAGVRASLVSAALTMNLSMTKLHDQLAAQAESPSPAQKTRIRGHAEASVRQLLDVGVTDPLWLEAVRHHHDATPGPLDARPLGQQLGRMIQRADVFAARLSPRKNRPAMSPAAAAQAAYLDERRQPDQAGMALIKATGIYPPGALVELASAEVAVVLHRGAKANQPVAAAVLDKSGRPTAEPALRDTSDPVLAVARSLAPHQVPLSVSLEALLDLY